MVLESTDRLGNKTTSSIGIIGAPLGFGAGQIGSELGVNAMRLSRIRGRRLIEHIQQLGFEAVDHGDAEIVRPEASDVATGKAKHLREMAISCRNIFNLTSQVLRNREFPIILGGDHSIAIGTFPAVNAHYQESVGDVGLIWFDAHADINTPETTLTGNIHGMPLAVLFGHGPRELTDIGGDAARLRSEYFAHVGARDLDEGERSRVHELGLRDNFFTMSDIDRRGMPACVADAIAIVSRAPGGFAVTFDIDAIDPRFAPGSGTLVRGGLTYREAHLGLEMLATCEGLRSFEIVEVNPMLDQSNITVELACELTLSVLGKTIL
jgi:arginase